MLRLMKGPAKSQRKVVRTDQLHWRRSLHNWVVYLKILIWENQSCMEREIGIKTRRQISQGRLTPNKNLGKKGSIARNYPKVGSHERGPCASKFGERSYQGIAHQERCASGILWVLQETCDTPNPRLLTRSILFCLAKEKRHRATKEMFQVQRCSLSTRPHCTQWQQQAIVWQKTNRASDGSEMRANERPGRIRENPKENPKVSKKPKGSNTSKSSRTD